MRRCSGRTPTSTSLRSSKPAGSTFIGGVPMNWATNDGRRPGVDLLRRADLLQLAAAHHRDPRAHRHRLDLVVGDVDERRVEPPVQVDQLGSGLAAQLGVEVRQRLVHAEDRRLAHDRPGQRDPLTLAAAELAGLAVEVLARGRAPRAADLGLARARSAFDAPRTFSGNSMFACTVLCGYSA